MARNKKIISEYIPAAEHEIFRDFSAADSKSRNTIAVNLADSTKWDSIPEGNLTTAYLTNINGEILQLIVYLRRSTCIAFRIVQTTKGNSAKRYYSAAGLVYQHKDQTYLAWFDYFEDHNKITPLPNLLGIDVCSENPGPIFSSSEDGFRRIISGDDTRNGSTYKRMLRSLPASSESMLLETLYELHRYCHSPSSTGKCCIRKNIAKKYGLSFTGDSFEPLFYEFLAQILDIDGNLNIIDHCIRAHGEHTDVNWGVIDTKTFKLLTEGKAGYFEIKDICTEKYQFSIGGDMDWWSLEADSKDQDFPGCSNVTRRVVEWPKLKDNQYVLVFFEYARISYRHPLSETFDKSKLELHKEEIILPWGETFCADKMLYDNHPIDEITNFQGKDTEIYILDRNKKRIEIVPDENSW